jgi:uncharacterized membrane protein YedE/YeeE
MFLKNWIVIIILAVVGVLLAGYWLSLPETPVGVTPQGGLDDAVTAIAALAGAITTIGGAVFGVLGKLNEYKKAKLDIEEKQMALDEKKQSRQET